MTGSAGCSESEQTTGNSWSSSVLHSLVFIKSRWERYCCCFSSVTFHQQVRSYFKPLNSLNFTVHSTLYSEFSLVRCVSAEWYGPSLKKEVSFIEIYWLLREEGLTWVEKREELEILSGQEHRGVQCCDCRAAIVQSMKDSCTATPEGESWWSLSWSVQMLWAMTPHCCQRSSI